jgi:Protein of unknown function (DUF2934)
MDTQVTEEELRSLAYRLWERAGCPDGRADEFWEQARLQLCPEKSPTKADSMNDSDEFVEAPEVGSGERTSTTHPADK